MSENYAKKVIEIGLSRVGITEYPADSNKVDANTWYYCKEVSGSSYPWCCVEMQYEFYLAGMSPLLKRTASCADLGDWFKSNNRFYTTPKIGDLVFFKFNTTRHNRWANHVGLVIGVNNDGTIVTIEGNTSFDENGSQDNGGAVARKVRKSTYIVGYGRPQYDIEPNTSSTATNNNSFNMVDISHHNTIKSFASLSNDVNNIIIRMGYIASKTGILTTDKKFKEHIENAISHKMNIGLYCWDQSLNENEAIALADYCINVIKPYNKNINLPIFIDSEYYNSKREGRADNISIEQRTKNLVAFCERIKSNGYTPGVYASESWFKSNVKFNDIKNYIIWCAKYSTNKPNISKYDIWQCGSKEFIWASAPIDINIIYNNIKNISNTSTVNTTTSDIEDNSISYVLGKITASVLNIRSTNSTSGTIVGTYKNGYLVKLLQSKNGWYKTSKGWISGRYVDTNIYGTVSNCNALNVRKEPKIENGNVMFSIPKNTKVKILDLSDNDKWIKVSINNKIGWCSANYLKY